ncbi:MAG TPA: CNNM domain-containing protein, partial [Spirochaetota bacterium]|nr:CNNM domain-containing protein [Spirochaetota bacterium]
MVLLSLSVILTILISAACSLFEAAIVSVSLTDIAKISKTNLASANILQKFKKNIQEPVGVSLIIKIFAYATGTSVSGVFFYKKFGLALLPAFALIFPIVLVIISDIIPKTYGIANNVKVAAFCAKPVDLLVKIFKPFLYIYKIISETLKKKAGKGKKSSVDDIAVLTRFASMNNMISKDQEQILSQTLKLQKIKVSDIMVKKEEAKYLSTNMNLMEALLEAHIYHHTRLLVVKDGNIDDVVGYVNFKDIISALQTNPEDPSLLSICRPIINVREDDVLLTALKVLSRSRQHIASVKDDKGGLAGLTTLEDVIETIIGDLNEEIEELPTFFYKISDTRYIAGGGIPMKSFREKFHLSLPDVVGNLNDMMLQLF